MTAVQEVPAPGLWTHVKFGDHAIICKMILYMLNTANEDPSFHNYMQYRYPTLSKVVVVACCTFILYLRY